MQVIAAGFDPSSEPAKILDKDHTSDGLLIVNAEDQHRINSSLKKDYFRSKTSGNNRLPI
jgi:hypothetical protein